MDAPHPVTVVVADDEPHIRLFVKSALTSMGWKVVAEAADGIEAVDRYRTHRPDLLLLDMNMPRMDGRAALAAVRAEFPDAFVVMLTSLASAEDVERCLAAGAEHYLRKDTPLADLKADLQGAWHQRAAGNAGGTP